jgi:hypothetical protein
MARGDKSKYTDKQKRQAEHIEESYEERGVSKEEAERRAWATENKISGGGRQPGGSGRGRGSNKGPSKKGGKKGGKASGGSKSSGAKKGGAKKGSSKGGRKSSKK